MRINILSFMMTAGLICNVASAEPAQKTWMESIKENLQEYKVQIGTVTAAATIAALLKKLGLFGGKPAPVAQRSPQASASQGNSPDHRHNPHHGGGFWGSGHQGGGSGAHSMMLPGAAPTLSLPSENRAAVETKSSQQAEKFKKFLKLLSESDGSDNTEILDIASQITDPESKKIVETLLNLSRSEAKRAAQRALGKTAPRKLTEIQKVIDQAIQASKGFSEEVLKKHLQQNGGKVGSYLFFVQGNQLHVLIIAEEYPADMAGVFGGRFRVAEYVFEIFEDGTLVIRGATGNSRRGTSYNPGQIHTLAEAIARVTDIKESQLTQVSYPETHEASR